MGQSESRSLARIRREDSGRCKRDRIGGGSGEQIQVLEKRDLSEGDGTDKPTSSLGRSGRPPKRIGSVDVERERSVFKQTVIDLPDGDKHEGPGSQQTTLAIEEPRCCCHLAHLNGGNLQQDGNLAQLPIEFSPTSVPVKGSAKKRQARESWILEELDFIAERSARQAARDRKAIVRIARGVRCDQDGRRPGGGNDNCSSQQINNSQESKCKELAKLDEIASESAHASAQTSSPDDIKDGQHVSHPIRHSHKRRDHVTISSGDIKSRATIPGDVKQYGTAQQKKRIASQQSQQAPVDILAATEANGGAPDESEILTTQARPVAVAAAATSTGVSARTCECIGTADTGDGFANATNLACANSAITTERPAKEQQATAHHRRTDSSNTRDGNAIEAAVASANAAEAAACASVSVEISNSAVCEPGQKSSTDCRAAGKVQASGETDEELTSDKRTEGEPAGRNSDQQSALANIVESAHESAPSPADCRDEEKKEKTKQQQRQAKQVTVERSRLADVLEEPPDCATITARRLTWSELATKYGRMTRKGQMLVPPELVGPASENVLPTEAAARSRTSRLKDSCFCHVLCALLQTIFPICGAFKDYSLPGDLLADLAAGFTVAILHIPQGMAYGLLSGVEPIHGLYVSFIPVLIMSFMSKSRHASYGTFAIISMLLVNTIQQVRSALREEQSRMFGAAGLLQANSTSPALVITDNHRPAPARDSPEHSQKDLLLRDLIGQSTSHSINEFGTQNYLIDGANLAMAGDGNEQVAAAAASSLSYAHPSNIEILSCVCIVCGIVHITMSLMRLGVLSLMFSDQLISSFTTAGAVHVLTSQLPGLFDLNLAPIKSELFKCMRIWWQFTQALVYDGFNQTTGLLSLASIAFLLLVKELIEPRLRARFKRLTCLPSELILMAIVISCSSYFKFESNYHVKIVGEVPSGLPEPKVPRLELVPYVIKDSISIALITFAMNLSIAQVYAKKFRYELNANQELFALGSANIISSFFSCFPCASSLSRSSIQSNLNVKSQLCSLFSCCIVVAIICYFAHILHDLPKSTLSCIIVVALKGILMQLRDLYDNWRLSKLDALVWILTFVSVLIFGVTYGLILGILSSIFMIFLRLLTPQHSILARLPGTDIFVDKDAFADCQEIEQVKIFRFNSALCYLNRTRLRSMIEKLLPGVFPPTGFRAICAQLHSPSRAHPFYESTSVTALANGSSPARVSHIIIDCSALSYCDYSGATTLVELVEDLETRKVAVYLAASPLKLIDMLEKIQGQKDIVSRNVYPTISDALGQISYLQSVVVMPTVATIQEKRSANGRSSSLTGSFMSRSSDPSKQQAPTGGDGRGMAEVHHAGKRPSILFAPDKGK